MEQSRPEGGFFYLTESHLVGGGVEEATATGIMRCTAGIGGAGSIFCCFIALVAVLSISGSSGSGSGSVGGGDD